MEASLPRAAGDVEVSWKCPLKCNPEQEAYRVYVNNRAEYNRRVRLQAVEHTSRRIGCKRPIRVQRPPLCYAHTTLVLICLFDRFVCVDLLFVEI